MTRFNLFKDDTPIETNEETPFDKAEKERLEYEEKTKRLEKINNMDPLLRILATTITWIAFVVFVLVSVWAYKELKVLIPEMVKVLSK